MNLPNQNIDGDANVDKTNPEEELAKEIDELNEESSEETPPVETEEEAVEPELDKETDEETDEVEALETQKEKDRFEGVVGSAIQKIKKGENLVDLKASEAVKDEIIKRYPDDFKAETYSEYEKSLFVEAQKKTGLSETEARLLAKDREERIQSIKAKESEKRNKAFQSVFSDIKLSEKEFNSVYKDFTGLAEKLDYDDAALLALTKLEKRKNSLVKAKGITSASSSKSSGSIPKKTYTDVTLDNIDELSAEELYNLTRKH